jgi:hypothetical protein
MILGVKFSLWVNFLLFFQKLYYFEFLKTASFSHIHILTDRFNFSLYTVFGWSGLTREQSSPRELFFLANLQVVCG